MSGGKDKGKSAKVADDLLRVLDKALGGEREATKHLKRLASEADDPELRELFAGMVREEERHSELLRAQRDRMASGKGGTAGAGGAGVPAATEGGGAGKEGGAAEMATALLREAGRMVVEAKRLRLDTVSMIVHDLSQPLTSINGYVDILSEAASGKLTGEPARLLSLVKVSVDRLTSMVDDIMVLSSTESGRVTLKLDPVDVKGVVEEVAMWPSGGASEQERPVVTVFSGQTVVKADKKLVTKVITILMDNASRYSPMDADIKVSVAGVPDGGVRVSVSDKGPKLAEEDVGRVFEPFFRGDGERKSIGCGVGLALASRLVTAHGGVIEVKNNDGEDSGNSAGVTFSFTLPEAPPK